MFFVYKSEELNGMRKNLTGVTDGISMFMFVLRPKFEVSGMDDRRRDW